MTDVSRLLMWLGARDEGTYLCDAVIVGFNMDADIEKTPPCYES